MNPARLTTLPGVSALYPILPVATLRDWSKSAAGCAELDARTLTVLIRRYWLPGGRSRASRPPGDV
jgi:hypothetical protein